MSRQTFSIQRRIEIDAAHRVPDHKSKCFNVHGHRYVIEAKCGGLLQAEGEQRGMVMDFGFLKELMIQVIHDPCDHGIILYKDDPMVATTKGSWWKIEVMDSVPTAENLARKWFEELQIAIEEFFSLRSHESLPSLLSVRVWETPNCVATYPHKEML